jgi:hypothetical protein
VTFSIGDPEPSPGTNVAKATAVTDGTMAKAIVRVTISPDVTVESEIGSRPYNRGKVRSTGTAAMSAAREATGRAPTATRE